MQLDCCVHVNVLGVIQSHVTVALICTTRKAIRFRIVQQPAHPHVVKQSHGFCTEHGAKR